MSGGVLVTLFFTLLIESVSTTEPGSLLSSVLSMLISGVSKGKGEVDGALSSSMFLTVTVDVSVPA